MPTYKLIIVDDSLDLLSSWEEILALDGHTVHTFTHAKQALERSDLLHEADAIISDYYLPDINGLAFLTQIRDVHAHLPLILLTGSNDALLRESVAKQPNVTLLHKPIRIEQLESTLEKVVNRAAG